MCDMLDFIALCQAFAKKYRINSLISNMATSAYGFVEMVYSTPSTNIRCTQIRRKRGIARQNDVPLLMAVRRGHTDSDLFKFLAPPPYDISEMAKARDFKLCTVVRQVAV